MASSSKTIMSGLLFYISIFYG